jgi:thymidylate kinase
MPVFSFNGGEGVGKTTVISEIEKILTKRGIEVKVFQAFGTTIGGHVRKMHKRNKMIPYLMKFIEVQK